mmetsp:Transcript_4072/g.6333  ORF Transcript_4072/g.6333 Transcript_4072/m.6333 type:complete len:207 (+) Transcript_4072:165-785(+)
MAPGELGEWRSSHPVENNHIWLRFIETTRQKKLKLFAIFTSSQLAYWTILAAERAGLPGYSLPPLAPLDAVEGLEKTPNWMIDMYSHPGWVYAGFGASALCCVLTRLYTSNFVSAVAVDPLTKEVEICVHTYFGNVSTPTRYKLGRIKFLEINPGYISVQVPGKQGMMMMDSEGTFEPVAAEHVGGLDPASKKQSVLKYLGVTKKL